uniref:Uncharacterized protein n=1 Tax=Rhodosorus marinus TaxID=101924 RepID=A0A7S0BD09_9RHOD
MQVLTNHRTINQSHGLLGAGKQHPSPLEALLWNRFPIGRKPEVFDLTTWFRQILILPRGIELIADPMCCILGEEQFSEEKQELWDLSAVVFPFPRASLSRRSHFARIGRAEVHWQVVRVLLP